MRKSPSARRLNESAMALDKAMQRAGIPSSDKESFLDWTIASLWNTFKEERMNQRIMIENEIRQLGLRFPNGTVKKDYSVSFELPQIKSPTSNSSAQRSLALSSLSAKTADAP